MYTEVLETQGIKVPFVPNVISERMADVIRKGRYEASEIKLLRKLLRADDRVLELGAGVGVVSTVAAKIVGPGNVTTIEANPDLIQVIKETHKLNGVENVEVLHGVGTCAPTSATIDFWMREHFWASSLAPLKNDTDTTRRIQVPQIDLNDLAKRCAPTVLVMDIEGGEIDLLPELDLSTCRHVVIELHPRVYGLEGVDRCIQALSAQNLVYDAKRSRGGTVVVFSKVSAPAEPKQRVTAVTCMKDEAPFILEWLAFHQVVGITDFLIFTNDCTDGTIELLDRLDELGHVRHLPNYSNLVGSPRHQLRALDYAPLHKEFRDADWVISMDVDEFINIHIGDRTLDALFEANQEANVISLTHLDFGCSGVQRFEDALITEQFTACVEKSPKKSKRRGIKTLIHKSVPAYDMSNHRPKFKDPHDATINWIDGSGEAIHKNYIVGEHKGLPPQGAYAQVQLNHYPIRSTDTYLAKSTKGNVVAKDSYVGLEYFEKRNGSFEIEETIQVFLPKVKKQLAALKQDAIVNALHEKAVKTHKDTTRKLLDRPDMNELLTKLLASHRASKRYESAN